MRAQRYILLSLIYLLACVATASDPSIRFEQLSVEDGLPQSSAKAIIQDNQGFLWVGTQDGLARYDGYSFRVFRRIEGNPNSLSANYIRVLYEDRKGYIWIGTDGGLNRFDPKTEQFTRYLNNENEPNSLSGNNIWAIAEDQQGYIWVGTFAKGLNRFNPSTQTFDRYSHDPKTPNTLSGTSARVITADSRGALWIGTEQGLNRLDIQTSSFTIFRGSPDESDSLRGDEVNAIIEDRQGTMWIGTHEGLNRLDPSTPQFTHYIANKNDPDSLSHTTVRTIYEDSQGTFWVGTNDGLNKFYPDTGKFARYHTDANNPNSLSSNSIYVITEDHEGFIWVGTYAGGLNYFNPNIEQFNHYRSNANDPYSLTNNNIFSLAVDRRGTLWVGTSGGLNRYDPDTKRFTAYRHDPSDDGSLRHNVVLAIAEDRTGKIWLGTPRGLSYFDADEEQFVHYLSDTKNSNSLSNNVVSVITEDRQGMLWIGTLGGGLTRFNPVTEEIRHYHFDIDNPNSLSHNRVKTILEDRHGIIWIGTRGGLNQLDPSTEQFKRYYFDENNSKTITSNAIFSILEDHAGTLWVGTNNGLNRMVSASGIFERFNEDDGLPNNVIYTLKEDNENNLWASTNNGLSRYNPITKNFTSYYDDHGLQNNEFNGGAAFKSDKGELFFGGINGFNRFFPEKLKIENREPVVVFTDMLLLNESVPIIPKNGVNHLDKINNLESHTDTESAAINNYSLEEAINYIPSLTLTHKENLVSFEFSSLYFSNPERSRYLYKLEEFDSDWITADYRNRRATYTNLPSGDFILRVRASNFDDVWSMEAKSIRVTVLPPPWLSWWAYTIYIIVLVSSVSAYVIIQRNKVIAERKYLEAQVNKRTKAIRTLAEIAQDISSTLTIERLISQLHSHLVKSIDLSVLALGVLEKNENRLRFESCLENGKKIPLSFREVDSEQDLAGWCVTKGKEIVLKQYSDRFKLLSKSNTPVIGEKMQSIIYLPIRSRSEQMLGCLTVQSDEENAFSDEDTDFIRTITNYAGIALDNIISHQELKRMSTTDFLTNLPNRRSFIESSNYLIKVANRNEYKVCLALGDIDYFKQFNDQHGHDCGDFVLQQVASLFRTHLRDQDIVARWGGEEFIFLFSNTAMKGGVTVLEKLRTALETENFEYEGKQLTIRATFGISEINEDQNIEAVIEQADLALYEGKHAGRNCVYSSQIAKKPK